MPILTNLEITDNKGFTGGGIFFSSCFSPMLSNLEIANNKSSSGGGIYFEGSSPQIRECLFSGNIIGYGGGGKGGGIFITDFTNSVIRNCKIIGNGIEEETASYGGGIYCGNGIEPKIIGCEIKDNSVLWGSGIACEFSSPIINNCEISGNKAFQIKEHFSAGGGIYFGADCTAAISNTSISGNNADYGAGIHCFGGAKPTIKNCQLLENEAFYSGGALYADQAFPMVINCTMADNVASGYKSAASENSSKVTISNSIVWNNTERSLGGSGEMTISSSDVDVGNSGEQSFSSNPLFVTGPWGDYYLSQVSAGQEIDSPCIDAGSDSSEGSGLDMTTTRTDGAFDTGSVDIGYHYPPNITIDLYLSKEKGIFMVGDKTELMLDLKTAGADVSVDIYIILISPDGTIYSGMSWAEGLLSALSGIMLTGGIDLSGVELLSFGLPSDNPPIGDNGVYTFAVAAIEAGTMNFVSNIASVSFAVE